MCRLNTTASHPYDKLCFLAALIRGGSSECNDNDNDGGSSGGSSGSSSSSSKDNKEKPSDEVKQIVDIVNLANRSKAVVLMNEAKQLLAVFPLQ